MLYILYIYMRVCVINNPIIYLTSPSSNFLLIIIENRQWSYMGVMRILDNLGMFEWNGGPDQILVGPPNTVLCSKGFWVSSMISNYHIILKSIILLI